MLTSLSTGSCPLLQPYLMPLCLILWAPDILTLLQSPEWAILQITSGHSHVLEPLSKLSFHLHFHLANFLLLLIPQFKYSFFRKTVPMSKTRLAPPVICSHCNQHFSLHYSIDALSCLLHQLFCLSLYL